MKTKLLTLLTLAFLLLATGCGTLKLNLPSGMEKDPFTGNWRFK